MIVASLSLSASTGWFLALVVVMITILIAIRGLSKTPRLVVWGSAGKVVAISLIGFSLLEPLWNSNRVQPRANLMIVLADNSRSLQITDSGSLTDRRSLLAQTLQGNPEWLRRMSQDFDVRQFLFDSTLRPSENFAELDSSGRESKLVSALRNVRDRFRDRPVAGIILLTDGVSSEHWPSQWKGEGLPPVWTVPIGAAAGLHDLSITRVELTTSAFEDAPVSISVEVAATGIEREKIVVEVRDQQGESVGKETRPLASGRSCSFRFQLKEAPSGINFYEVFAWLESDRFAKETLAVGKLPAEKSPEANGKAVEATYTNNRRLAVADRPAGPFRILYVSGRPNWEYKFLRRAVEHDDQIQMTAMVRIAKREPKFDFRSRDGESTNPLFRGFDRVDEGTEQFDQPVLVRLNTQTPEELRDGFPTRAEDLFRYDALILDDLEAEFFTVAQHDLINRFVAERGGGFLMLGGLESFQEGKYLHTAIGRMLPVQLEIPQRAEAGSETSYRLGLSREGLLQPWLRLRTNELDEEKRLESMPPFKTINRSGAVKPGANVYIEALQASGQRLPAFVTQRFGAGRTAAMLAADLWRWPLARTDEERAADDPGKAWRQIIRWLVTDTPRSTEARFPTEGAQDRFVQVQVLARNAAFTPEENAKVVISVAGPEEKSFQETAEPSLKEPGLHSVMVPLNAPGQYRASAETFDEKGEILGRSEIGWVHEPDAIEFSHVLPQREQLKQLANQTGGEMIELAELDRFSKQVPLQSAPLMEPVVSPQWHAPWFFVLIVAGLCFDWGFRRWSGLA